MDLKQALEVLKKNGYKYTGKRETMMHIFWEEGRYLTAKEVLDQMQKIFRAQF